MFASSYPITDDDRREVTVPRRTVFYSWIRRQTNYSLSSIIHVVYTSRRMSLLQHTVRRHAGRARACTLEIPLRGNEVAWPCARILKYLRVLYSEGRTGKAWSRNLPTNQVNRNVLVGLLARPGGTDNFYTDLPPRNTQTVTSALS